MRSHSLDGIAKANILVADEPWQAHAIGFGVRSLVFSLGMAFTSSSFDTLPRHPAMVGPPWFAVG